MINKDLGLVTAYAYAVSKGYTGTEDEFAELMASYASVAEQAEESAEDSEAWAIGKRGGQDVPSTDATYHNNSKYYAGQAGTSASTAASSASAASASESNAAASASSAAGSASSAATSAATATEKAGEASTSASEASTSATDAAGSATNAASSATAASASATAAGNAQTAAETAQGKAEDAQEAAEQAQSDAEAAAQSVSQSAAQISQNASDIGNLKSAIDDPVTGLDSKAPVIIDTASGAIASFEDGAYGMPLKSLTVNVEPAQAGNGDPSPTNIRPISGWTGANVTRTGKNLLPNISGPRNEGSVFIGQANESTYPTHLIAGVTYAISFRTNTGGGFAYMKENGGSNLSIGVSGVTYTPEKDMNVQIWVYGNGLTSVSDFQLEVGNAATAYEPYQGNTYNITFPSEAGTVYGGTLDVTSGKLTVNWALVDMGTLNWSETTYAGVTMMVCSLASIDRHSGQPVPAISSIYEASDDIWSSGTLRDKIFSINYTGEYIYVYDSAYTDAAAFKTAVSGAQLAYKIPTSVEYTLTPTQIETLFGTNNIWADCGDVTVDYPADTKLFIQKVNKPTDDDMTADAQIASGKYFIIGNNLYLSTTTIPAGDEIIPGTNCTKTDLAAALNALNA